MFGPVVAWVPEPLLTRNSRAISLPFLRLEPRGDILEPGARRLDVQFVGANDLRRMPEGGPYAIREDAEVDALYVRYAWGLPRGWEAAVEAPLMSRGGGFMDPLIEFWHEHVLGIHNLRSTVPYGLSEIIVPGSPRFGSAAGIGDVTGGLSRKLGERWLASFAVKAPTGDARKLLGSGAADAGASIYYRTAFGPRWAFHAQAGLVAQGKPTMLQGGRGLVDQESLALVYRRSSRDAWIGQWQSERSALSTGVAGSDSTHRTLSLGYERKLSEKQSIQAYFTEDGDWLNYRVPELVNIGPDFTIGLNWRTRF